MFMVFKFRIQHLRSRKLGVVQYLCIYVVDWLCMMVRYHLIACFQSMVLIGASNPVSFGAQFFLMTDRKSFSLNQTDHVFFFFLFFPSIANYTLWILIIICCFWLCCTYGALKNVLIPCENWVSPCTVNVLHVKDIFLLGQFTNYKVVILRVLKKNLLTIWK